MPPIYQPSLVGLLDAGDSQRLCLPAFFDPFRDTCVTLPTIDDIKVVLYSKLEYIRNMCPTPEEAQSLPIGSHHLDCAIEHPLMAIIGITLGIIGIILCALTIQTVVVTVILPLVIFVMRGLLMLGDICVGIAVAFFKIVLHLVGFGIKGITAGSPAALWQSVYYGAVVPAGSIFARLTSCAMTLA